MTVKKSTGCPPAVAIGRHLYTIVWHEGYFPRQGGGEEVMGQCRFVEAELHIRQDMADSVVKDTVMHECLHAIGYEVDSDSWGELASHRAPDGTLFNIEEHIVTTLASPMITFIANNPDLIAWLTNEV